MTTTETGYATSITQFVHAAHGIDYAYRDLGSGTVPQVLLQHFRGNLDNWDAPLLPAPAEFARR